MFSKYSANDFEGTVNKLHRRRYVKKSMVRQFHHSIFPLKHEESNNAGKVLVNTNEDSLMTNSDNYIYLDCWYGMLLHLRTGHFKKILDLVLIYQVLCTNPMYKIVLAFCGRLRLIAVQELCDKDDIELIVIIDE